MARIQQYHELTKDDSLFMIVIYYIWAHLRMTQKDYYYTVEDSPLDLNWSLKKVGQLTFISTYVHIIEGHDNIDYTKLCSKLNYYIDYYIPKPEFEPYEKSLPYCQENLSPLCFFDIDKCGNLLSIKVLWCDSEQAFDLAMEV